MAGLDSYAAVNTITDWLERWYSKPVFLGLIVMVLIVVIGHFHPHLAELLSIPFSFLFWILKSLFPQLLSVRYGYLSADFYENLLALMFFSSTASAILSIALYVFRYYKKPSGFAEFALKRWGDSYVAFIFFNLLSLLLIWAGLWMIGSFYGFTAGRSEVSKSVFDFGAYCFIASAAVMMLAGALVLPVSSSFYLFKLIFTRNSHKTKY